MLVLAPFSGDVLALVGSGACGLTAPIRSSTREGAPVAVKALRVQAAYSTIFLAERAYKQAEVAEAALRVTRRLVSPVVAPPVLSRETLKLVAHALKLYCAALVARRPRRLLLRPRVRRVVVEADVEVQARARRRRVRHGVVVARPLARREGAIIRIRAHVSQK